MATPRRRSARQRKANPKYLDTGWDKRTLRLLRDSPAESEEEFDAEASTSSEDEVLSDASQGSVDSAPVESDERLTRLTRSSYHQADTPRRRRSDLPAPVTGLPKGPPIDRSRGIASLQPTNTTQTAIDLIGDDLKPVLEKWFKVRDITLPSRKTLAELHASPSLPQELIEDVAIDEEDVAIVSRQELELIDSNSARAAGYLADAAEQSIVLGPVGKQKLTKTDHLKPLDVSEAWSNATGSEVANNPAPSLPQSTSSAEDHRGWIINVGEKVQSLAWLPGNDNSTQLLTIACRCTSKQRSHNGSDSTKQSSAFQPSASYPASIQLWAIHTATRNNANNSAQAPLTPASPELYIIYGLDTGDIRQHQWQPSPPSKHLKLLAVLSTDGCVRILAINTAYLAGHPRAYIRVKTPVLHLSPSNAVFTTMCWASTTDLIVGTSDGTVQIYNILDDTNPMPYFSHQIHSTYVMSITSTFPSSTPTCIASTSAAGNLVFTDLRAPDQDRVHVQRATVPAKALIYSPCTRSFIDISNPSNTLTPHLTSEVVLYPLRHLHNALPIFSLPETSNLGTALAGSPHHPCVLIGNARGDVFATNYIRSMLNSHVAEKSKASRKGKGGYLQKIYAYDWRPLTPSERAERHANASAGLGNDGAGNGDMEQTGTKEKGIVDPFHRRNLPSGLSRFTEGFVPEPIDNVVTTRGPQESSNASIESSNGRRKDRQKPRDPTTEESFSDLPAEEEQAVTCMEWNPNRRCVGWMAVGYGSGILRIADLSHDAE